MIPLLNYHSKVALREFKHLKELNVIINFIQKSCIKQVLKSKHQPSLVVIVESVDTVNNFISARATEPLLEMDIILYMVLANAYYEFQCTVIEKRENNQLILQVHTLFVPLNTRKYTRINLQDNGDIYVVRTRISRNVIEIDSLTLPVSVKVHLSDYSKRYSSLADKVSINLYDSIVDGDLIKEVQTSNKYLFVSDTQNIESYVIGTDEAEKRFDYLAYLHTRVAMQMANYKKQGIISEIIIPILYANVVDDIINLGYIHLVSYRTPLLSDVVDQAHQMVSGIVERIEGSNLILDNERQYVTDISNDGMRLQIINPDLQQAFMREIVCSCSIVFKLQQPITVGLRIIYVAENFEQAEANNTKPTFFVGVKLEGRSEESNHSERYKLMIKSLS